MTEKAEGETPEENGFEVVTSDSPVQEEPKAEEGEGTPEEKATPKEDKPKAAEPKADRDELPENVRKAQARLKRQRTKARDEAAQLREENRRLREAQEQGEPKKVDPDPADYDTWDEYQAATKKPEAKETPKAESEEPKAADYEFEDARDTILDVLDEDLTAKVTNEDFTINRDGVIAISESEDPKGVIAYLADHPEVQKELAELKPHQLGRRIAKLETDISKPAPGKRQTKAPEPIDPEDGGGVTTKSEKDMSFAEFEEARNRQEQKGKGFW